MLKKGHKLGILKQKINCTHYAMEKRHIEMRLSEQKIV